MFIELAVWRFFVELHSFKVDTLLDTLMHGEGIEKPYSHFVGTLLGLS
jgi:hypothetical protein